MQFISKIDKDRNLKNPLPQEWAEKEVSISVKCPVKMIYPQSVFFRHNLLKIFYILIQFWFYPA